MATAYSAQRPAGRVAVRRDQTLEEALAHALDIVTSDGAGAVTVSEVARRLGMRSPSLYKYFPSRHALYDQLFARGHLRVAAFVDAATGGIEPGLDRVLASARAMVRWSIEEPGLAALLYWRPVPGFVPSDESFAPSQDLWRRWREDLGVAARDGSLGPTADSDDAMRLLTVLISGICSQQLANEPGVGYEEGRFTRLTEDALAMFVDRYSPEPVEPGATHP